VISIGIDVHKVQCVATIKRNTSKKMLKQLHFNNDGTSIKKFIAYIKRTCDGDVQAVCESTGNYWIKLHDMLEDYGINTILAHPAKTKIIAHAKLKDDKVDSEALADLLRADLVAESYVPSKYYRDLRGLARERGRMVGSSTRHKNKIHAIIAKYDYKQPTKGFSKKMAAWIHEIDVSEFDRMALDVHSESIETIKKQIDAFERKIVEIGIKDERVKLIMTIPGISYIGALGIIAEIVDIERFSTPEKLVAYSGLSPSHRDSANVHKGGGITKQGSPWLRSAMTDAATVSVRYDSRMKSLYERITKRRGKQKAKVAAAREMLEIIWHMLKHAEPYRTQNPKLTARKYKKMQTVL